MVGRYISDELKEMALSMSLQGLRDLDIHEYTGISVRSLKRLRRTHRQTGEVSRKPIAPGRPRDLTSMHRKVRSNVSQVIFVSQNAVPL
jgi:transposase